MTELRPGTTIAVCGIDGAGKTTLIEGLAAACGPGIAVRKKTDRSDAERVARLHAVWRDPGRILDGGAGTRAFGWATLFDSLAHAEQVRSALAADRAGVVLLDRWSLCVAAYCGHVLGLGQVVLDLLAAVPRPSLTLLLACDPATARRRLVQRGQPRPDEDLAILESFEDGYQWAAAQGAFGPVERLAAGDPAAVRAAAVEALVGRGLAAGP